MPRHHRSCTISWTTVLVEGLTVFFFGGRVKINMSRTPGGIWLNRKERRYHDIQADTMGGSGGKPVPQHHDVIVVGLSQTAMHPIYIYKCIHVATAPRPPRWLCPPPSPPPACSLDHDMPSHTPDRPAPPHPYHVTQKLTINVVCVFPLFALATRLVVAWPGCIQRFAW